MGKLKGISKHRKRSKRNFNKHKRYLVESEKQKIAKAVASTVNDIAASSPSKEKSLVQNSNDSSSGKRSACPRNDTNGRGSTSHDSTTYVPGCSHSLFDSPKAGNFSTDSPGEKTEYSLLAVDSNDIQDECIKSFRASESVSPKTPITKVNVPLESETNFLNGASLNNGVTRRQSRSRKTNRSSASRNILVRNNVNYGDIRRNSSTGDSDDSNTNKSNNVSIVNNFNFNGHRTDEYDERNDSSRSSPHGDVQITNNINCVDESSNHNSDSDREINSSTNNTNLPISYSTIRRHVRYLREYIMNLDVPLSVQVQILSELLNDSKFRKISSLAGIKPPDEVAFNEHVVKQVLKQINRSSTKDSCRGRVSDDKQSYKINVASAMMNTPESTNVNHTKSDKTLVKLLWTNTSMSKSSARRLVIKAHKRRCILTNSEKKTTWSIISHRNGYNTQQSALCSKLFEWIINHPHVITSPIPRDTVLVNVPQPNGTISKERVGKLLLEISVRELYQDLLKPPPVGISEVYCKSSDNILVSERYLRNTLPPQLRPISFSQKQLCACECCTCMRMLHTSLLKFRKTAIASDESSPSIQTRKRNDSFLRFEQYVSTVKNDEVMLNRHTREVINAMVCPFDEQTGLMHWKCAMGRCSSCPPPTIPRFEMDSNNILSPIVYGAYKFHTKCKLHGVLNQNTTTCVECEELYNSNDEVNVPKLSKRKEITMLESPIHKFHTETYIPMLKKYRYHLALVIILSKNYCKKTRTEAFFNQPSWLLSERDYAERLSKQLDGEIQSDHFGDNSTLSIEGCTLQYHKRTSNTNDQPCEYEIRTDFHSHMADFSRQDAATTFEHMCSMLEVHTSRHGKLTRNSVLLDHTDGCAKQYRSGNALFMMNIMSLKYDIVIDRAIGAPGHGKSIIDGLNAVDKHYLKKVMCMSGSTRADNIETRMSMYAMTKDSTLSFAEECARLCGLESRKYGVAPTSVHDKRKTKLNERFYHVQKPENVRYQNISKGTKGWIKHRNQKGNGIQHHYNFRADPALGVGFIAVRRIPCMCEGCITQLNSAWKANKHFGSQPRYSAANQDCVLWDVLGDLNDWRLVSIVDTDSSVSDDIKSTTHTIFESVIHDRTAATAAIIEEGHYGAIATTDPRALSGYYIFKFKSSAYPLPKSIYVNSEKISAGDMVCDIQWLNSVPKSTRLYSHGSDDSSELDSLVRVQHVVHADVVFEYMQSESMLNRTMRSHFGVLKKKRTILINQQCHDDILETILARSHLDYEEYISSTDNNFYSDDESCLDDEVI